MGALQRSALTRHVELTRKTRLARTALRRRRKKTLTAAEQAERLRFENAAAAQERCANCGSGGAWDPHHAGVYEQELRRLGLPLWDPDNALRLCRRCHALHHAPASKLTLSILRDENISYAFGVLGPRAYDYLRRRYTGQDRRLDAALNLSIAAERSNTMQHIDTNGERAAGCAGAEQ
jgi:hypothetical protein